jgi:ubiquitin-like 1-activating enzyme E1 B
LLLLLLLLLLLPLLPPLPTPPTTVSPMLHLTNCCCPAASPPSASSIARQVVKGRLAVNEPNLDSAGGFRYEEGEGLEEDEVEANAALLPRVLSELPGT